MAEIAQSPKTGEITVKRHGFGENHRKNTTKTAPNSQISNAPKQFLEIALKRAGAGKSFKANSDFPPPSNQPKRLFPTTRARS
jgi:hypothetical protein